jgi:hypothetical protein
MGMSKAKIPSPYIIRLSAHAFELKAQGMTYREIASELRCSTQTVFEAVDVGARFILRQHGADEEVAAMLRRLDAGVTAIWDAYQKGEPDAHASMERLEKRRARLLGLDAPTKVSVRGDLTVHVDDTAERAKNLLAEVEAYAAGAHDAAVNHASNGA